MEGSAPTIVEPEDQATPSVSQDWLTRKREEQIVLAHAHTMSWLCDAICGGRILVGPFISDPMDALHLLHAQEVTHIVNLCPLTTEKTKTGLNKAEWYMCFYRGEDANNITLVREPLITEAMTDAKKIAHYLEVAKRIVLILKENSQNKLYIHNKTGFEQEAFIAFLVWYLFDKRTFPVDVGMWLTNCQYERLLDNEEQRAILNEAIDILKQQQAIRNNGSMLKFVKSNGVRPPKRMKE